MGDGAHLAVHGLRRSDHPAAKRLADRLMAETDAEQRDLARGSPDQIQADAGFGWGAWTGRQHDRLRAHRQSVLHGQLVVTPHLTLGADIAQEVIEVERKAVVVVDKEDHGGASLVRWRAAVNHGTRKDVLARNFW